MDKTLSQKFQDRDDAFEGKLNSIKNEHSDRGILYSVSTVERGHRALMAELSGSRKTIVASISEGLPADSSAIEAEKLIDRGMQLLRNRKDFLEIFYIEKLKPVSAMFQDRQMIESYTNLTESIESSEEDLRLELSQEIAEFISSQGKSLYHRVINLIVTRSLGLARKLLAKQSGHPQ